MKTYAAFSGGADSTAMILRCNELNWDMELIFTPAGNEPPELFKHVDAMQKLTGYRMHRPKAKHDLLSLIHFFKALPNHRQRWCTRQLKIEPCIAWMRANALPNDCLCVGLRFDEEERRGIYTDMITPRFPLREWGWGKCNVDRYLSDKGVAVPERTNCMLCYGQRLIEWWRLWRDHPEEYEAGVQLEEKIGYTFRSPSRDTWPASMRDMRVRFEAGEIPRERKTKQKACRVCTL